MDFLVSDISPKGWLRILGRIFGEKVECLESRLDSMDIAYNDLPRLLGLLEKRGSDILRMRFGELLSTREIGIRLKRCDKLPGPLSQPRVLQIENKAFRRLRRNDSMMIIGSCIAGWWNIQETAR